MTTDSTYHNSWRVLSELGRGGQGKTFLVSGPGSDAPAVLKLLRLGDVERWSAIDRFRREVDVLRSLDHPQIPRWLDAFEDPERGLWGLVQAFVDGDTLEALRRAGPPPTSERLEALLRSALAPLGYLHSRVPPVIHRDLSPRNLIVAGDVVHIVDFGAVKAVGGDGASVTAVGTFGFMPLEQARGQALPASDLYALGVSLLCFATGLEPDALPIDPRSGRVDVIEALDGRGDSEAVVAALTAMTEPGLSARAASVEAVLALLAPRPSAEPRPARKPLRRGIWRLWHTLLPLLMVAALATLFVTSKPLPYLGQVGRLGGRFHDHATLLGDPPHLYGAVYSQDGARVGSFSSAKIILWDASTEAAIAEIAREDGEFRGAFGGAFSADGERFLAVTSEAASLWQGGSHTVVPLGQHVWRAAGRPASAPSIRALAASVDGGFRCAFEVWGERIVVIEPVTGALVASLPLGGPAGEHGVHAAFSPGASRLAFVSPEARLVRVHDLPGGEERLRLTLSADDGPQAIAITEAGWRVAVATASGVTLVEVGGGPPRVIAVPWSLSDNRGGEREVAFSVDGARLAVSAEDAITILDAATGERRDTLMTGSLEVRHLAFAPDGRTLAVTGPDAIHLFDLTGGRL